MRKREKIVHNEKIKRKIRWTYFDKTFVQFLSNRRIKSFTAFMKFMTRIGDGLVWVVLSIIFLAINIYAGMALLFSIVSQVLLQSIIKRLFSRQKPYVSYTEISNVIPPPDKFSFPSGHTAAAFAVAFVFYYFYPFLFIPMLIIASLIAFSRIYLGLHYPTDVLAGIILGLISALIGINLSLIIEL